MINVKDIRLTPEELARCIAFSRASSSSQQAIEFDQKQLRHVRTLKLLLIPLLVK